MAKKDKPEVDNEDEVGSILDFSENISDAEAPEPLPDREYPATIQKAEMKTSDRTGSRYIAVTFKINVDDYPADYDANNAPDGTTLMYMRLSAEDNVQSRYRMRKFIEAIGAKGGKRIDLQEWIGLTAKITTKAEEYEGVKRAAIVKVEAE